ncbi:MAG TPA: hypothetical protein VM715_01510 [Candidatus Acidoferrum sp.]|jgi:hypothetical protein|nr:hypothetical protein [Candidatus Acidoferrum sp.]
MRLQSFVVGSDEIELALGSNDGGREYIFVRLPLPQQDLSNLSLGHVQLFTLQRARDAIASEIKRLNERVSEPLNESV